MMPHHLQEQPEPLRAQDEPCQVCGNETFEHQDVLWPGLVDEWGLSPAEAAYIDIQQGTRCTVCKVNVRSQALARALLSLHALTGPLGPQIAMAPLSTQRVLEINEAGTLTPWLAQLAGRRLARYPEVDMRRLPYATGTFDLVIHSDTLEHVPDPVSALAECRRVLAPGGACLFTIPIVIGRLTRSREGLGPSYHGNPDLAESDYLVRTEFGADAWTCVLQAGFARCEIVSFKFPAGLAIIART
jgi:SAM-dependent methyltransferase